MNKISITDVNGIQKPYFYDSGNALSWQNHKFYLNPNFNYKKEYWDISLNVPLQLQLIHYKQADYALDKNYQQSTFNPNLVLNLKTGVEDYVRANINFTNNIGDVTSVFRGHLLSNYRTLISNNADLQTNSNLAVSLKYHLEKSIALTFANITASYNLIAANTIAFTTVNNQIQTTILVPLKNNSSRLSLGTDFSKQILALNGRIQLSATYNRLQTNLFINNELSPYFNSNVNATLGYDTKLANLLTISYNTKYNYSKGGSANQVFSFSSSGIDQFLTLGFDIKGKLFLESSAQHVLNHQQNRTVAQLFLLNSSLKYKFLKPKIDLSADFTNLLDDREYTTIAISPNSLSESTYALRNRMAVIRISYIF
jgi:hypothetical protein